MFLVLWRRERQSVVRLTRRANQGYIDIIAAIVKPAPENRQRVFCWRRTIGEGGFALSKPTPGILAILFSSRKV